MFLDGSGRTLLGFDKDHIRSKYQNAKSVFEMGRKEEHQKTQKN